MSTFEKLQPWEPVLDDWEHQIMYPWLQGTTWETQAKHGFTSGEFESSGPWAPQPEGRWRRPTTKGGSREPEPAMRHCAPSLLQPRLDQLDPFRLLINL